MSITHEKAQRLIQLNMEHMLNNHELAALSAHLRNCGACKEYAAEIKEVAELLVPIMKRQWTARPAPHSLAVILERSQRVRSSALLPMRRLAVSLVVMAFFFSAWQVVLSTPGSPALLPLQVPPIPTPSTQSASSTHATSTLQNCELILHPVGETDSLASIAQQFSVPVATIMDLNHLQIEVIQPSMELLIPVCNFTPTGTLHASTFTTTNTPQTIATTSTPLDRH
jgi:LysM repeat protein